MISTPESIMLLAKELDIAIQFIIKEREKAAKILHKFFERTKKKYDNKKSKLDIKRK